MKLVDGPLTANPKRARDFQNDYGYGRKHKFSFEMCGDLLDEETWMY